MKFSLFTLFFIILTCSNCNGNLSHAKQHILSGIEIDSIVVQKADRIMTIFSDKKKIKSYDIALGKDPIGKKHFEGDMKTPEGLYFIDAKSSTSKYHKNLNISYPNTSDMAYAKEQGKNAGGEIKIHGLPNNFKEENYKRSDWTWGCIALTNTEIDELFEHVKIGCPILLLP